MDNILKPCPVCGGKNVKYEEVFDFKCRLYCKDCDYYTRWHLKSVKGAIEEWNNAADKRSEA